MQLTVRQHYVPQTYLRSWQGEDGLVGVTDKIEGKDFRATTENVLNIKNYYEAPGAAPTNELERKFCEYEGTFAKTRDFIKFVADNAINCGQDIPTTVASMLDTLTHHAHVLREFAAVTYIRTPAALQAMKDQLEADEGSALAQAALNALDSAYTFNRLAFDSSLIERFRNLHIVVMWSSIGLNTCDRPCFDVNYADNLSNFGYDIGRNPATFAAFPLTPRLHLMFVPNINSQTPTVIGRHMPDALSVSHNELVVEKAERWIVCAP